MEIITHTINISESPINEMIRLGSLLCSKYTRVTASNSHDFGDVKKINEMRALLIFGW